MPIPENDPKLTAKLHRRWRGMGALIFAVFYSFLFSGHFDLLKTTIYLKDHVVLATDTAAVFADLTAPIADAGTHGTGAASSFLLVHRPLVSVLTLALTPGSDNELAAKKHAVAMLQAFAGAMMVVLLYHLLLWSGVNTWNAVFFAAVLGCSTTTTIFAAIPQTQIFSMLGLTAMLTAMARGKRAAWWEFSGAALYCVLCSHWNFIPVTILAIVRGVWRWRTTDSYKPLPSIFGSLSLLVLVALAGMKLQGWIYPHSSQMNYKAVAASSWSTLHQACARASSTPWLVRTQDAFFTNIFAPTATMLDDSTAKERQTRRTISLVDEEWFVLDFRHVFWAAWLILVLLGLTGLPTAAEHAGVATGALLMLGWQVFFYGALEDPGQRLLHSFAWTPAVVTVVGVGCGRCLEKFKSLTVPVGLLLLAFVIMQGTRSYQFMAEITNQLRISAGIH